MTSRFRHPASARLRPLFNREILERALLLLRFLSITSTTVEPNLGQEKLGTYSFAGPKRGNPFMRRYNNGNSRPMERPYRAKSLMFFQTQRVALGCYGVAPLGLIQEYSGED
jgi:hypothetical protein